MTKRFLAETFTPEVRAAQAASYGRAHEAPVALERDALGPDEVEFIGRRDSFYLSTITSSGWPYVQHRGGPKGFLKVLDPHTLGFADLRGNRQLLTTGNLAASDRAALMLVDYPAKERLKILGHARTLDARAEPSLADALSPTPELRRKVERVILIDVVAFDWNCPSYITPRYTLEEIQEMVGRSGGARAIG